MSTHDSSLLTDDFKTDPYWWDDAPRPTPGREDPPESADVVVVGSGYTGLQAALQTGRGGRKTVVLDAESLGFGCSSRNGGQVSTGFKPTYEELRAKHGHDVAFGIRREGIEALRYIGEFVEAEGIDCNWETVGRFHGAFHARAYETMARDIERQTKGLEFDAHMVPRSAQRDEIGTDLYHGGVVFPAHAALHPAKYHNGLLDAVCSADVTLVSHCPVTSIEKQRDRFSITTPMGKVSARDVVVATNGYSGPLSPWHQRRVIPIGSYMIATEPCSPNLIADLSPRGRVLSDSRKLVFYYRACPERRRILFGGRVALSETDPRVSGPRLHDAMCRIFPELRDTRISHSWLGFVAYTFDTLPHIGVEQGIHYAMGYCGSGVALASYYGMKIGQKVLGAQQGDSALESVPFQTRPLYTGEPWFLAPSVFLYQMRDRFNL